MKLLILSRYDRLGASSRLRSMQYVPTFEEAGINVDVEPLFSDAYVRDLKDKKRSILLVLFCYMRRVLLLLRARQYDAVWIEKESLPWLPSWIESIFLYKVKYILDFDDAIFHNYDRSKRWFVRYFLGNKIDRLMKRSSLVVCGNSYLCDRAKSAGATWVELIPTVIDIDRYSASGLRNNEEDFLRIVWIGSPSTGKYLSVIHEPLVLLSKIFRLKLRVVGCNLEMNGVDVELIPWSEDSEVESIASGDIGVMPLVDSPWERGKCGYKLIQYMGVCLPVVASAVGANCEIVKEGGNGYLAIDEHEWFEKLKRLLCDEQLRRRMGRAGRQLVEDKYCVQKTAPRLTSLIFKVCNKN